MDVTLVEDPKDDIHDKNRSHQKERQRLEQLTKNKRFTLEGRLDARILLVNLRERILDKFYGVADSDIRQKQAQLAKLRREFTDQHPDVIDAKSDLQTLTEQRNQLLKQTPPEPVTGNQPNVAQAQAELDGAEAILRALELDRANKQKEVERITAELTGLQARFTAAPGSEQKYIAMLGERSTAAQTYADLQRKQQAVLQNKKVTDSNAGENLELVDTASLPETPAAPNRWQIVGAGSLAGLLIGVAMAGVKEMKDTSLKNLKDVRVYTNLAVLSSIPLLENALLVRKQRRMAFLAWSVAFLIGLTGTTISVYYHFQ